jgi:hypothetical protein
MQTEIGQESTEDVEKRKIRRHGKHINAMQIAFMKMARKPPRVGERNRRD